MAEISSNDPRPWGVGDGSHKCQTLSVSLGDRDPQIRWDIRVDVRRGAGGFATLGVVRTLAAGAGPRTRIIVQAAVVGAVEWEVTCTPVADTVVPAKSTKKALLDLCVDECCAGTPGLFPSQYSSVVNQ